ncbi:beta-methylarginine biosynthesis bifunctional aminotransferase [Paenibacillus oleatilyticus]|uniref:beta-methylarginine biosynthesis bifunctional aminotransferase n=1 Tax=Paenibacillus oleatilyticus TaxID=2594886 RepID=UPI001C1FFDFF|nr:beta-methylarginine biosynthesis bifunctional aminotransferase [Paenibacillus oleatilyticus]MBU7314576.1 beta-methylarginine biosynthesis bifunctional aminotransferase [Paenibacillus oleatilyticus]
MQRITTSDSPFTLLQQRLQYVSLQQEKPWRVWVENVPQWETQSPTAQFEFPLVSEYAPCEGYPFLLDAIRNRENGMYGLQLEQDQILVTNGALHGLSLIFRSLYRPHAVALCQAPILGSIATILESYGYTIKYFTSHQGELDIERLKAECADPNVSLVYVNTPHNPTGDILSRNTLAQLAELVQRRGINLVADMIYDSLTFDGAQSFTPLAATSVWKNVYAVNSMSKNYGSPGLRIGWVMSDRENIRRMAGFFEQECVAICGIAQKQAQLLLERGNRDLVETIAARKKYIEAKLAAFQGISYMVPRGGTQFYVQLPVDDIDLFADYMLVNYSFAITTISNYQGGTGSYIRVPTVYPIETTEAALELLAEGIKSFSFHYIMSP